MKDLKSIQHAKATEGIEITFKDHAIQRYEERIFKGKRNVADAVPHGPYFDSASLEKQVRAGSVFLDDDYPFERPGFYIIYNNLIIFKGEKHAWETKGIKSDVLRINTVYPFIKKYRGLLVKKDRVSLADFF